MDSVNLIQQAERSSNGVNACSLTLNNCTVGNTLILSCAVRGSSNIPTLSDGWEVIGGGNVISDPSRTDQKIYFANKKVENATETVTLTQTTTGRIYLVCGEFSGKFSIVMRNDMANRGASDFTVTATKNATDDVILYAVTSAFYTSGRLQTCSPSDLAKLQGNSELERLACWFDNGSGAVSHTFKSCDGTGSYDAIVECVQLIPKKPKYLIRNNDIVYTIQNESLVEVVGDLNAQLFIDNGVDEIPSGTLLMTLSNPEVLCWTDSDKVPTLTATVKGIPEPQTIISEKIYLTDDSITGIESVLATCEGDLIISVSFDDKQTWKAWNGEQWATLSDDNTGMSKATLEAITFEQWNELYTGATGFYVRVSLLDATQSIEKIVFDFSN